jgi:hypothetical protein
VALSAEVSFRQNPKKCHFRRAFYLFFWVKSGTKKWHNLEDPLFCAVLGTLRFLGREAWAEVFSLFFGEFKAFFLNFRDFLAFFSLQNHKFG